MQTSGTNDLNVMYYGNLFTLIFRHKVLLKNLVRMTICKKIAELDIDKPITNPNLVNAIEEIKRGNKKGNYKIVLGEGTSITLLSIDNEQIIQKGESVMLGIPKEYPTDMVNKLKEYFVKMQNVDKAYLLWMVRGKESSYLLVLDSKISPQQLFPLIGQICQPFLNGKLLDMVLANSGLGKSAIEGQAPFFVR